MVLLFHCARTTYRVCACTVPSGFNCFWSRNQCQS